MSSKGCISEAFLLPVLALVIAQFPFEALGFHSDNGSEYINDRMSNRLVKADAGLVRA